jgi:hypothetical protein
MSNNTPDDTTDAPLDRLFVENAEDHPDEVVVDNLTTLDSREFIDRLESLAAAADAVETIAHDVERIRKTGLSDADARDLIYGRNAGVAKRDIEALFDGVDALTSGRADRPLVRLLAEVSGLTLSDTEDLIDELDRLNREYGDLGDE